MSAHGGTAIPVGAVMLTEVGGGGDTGELPLYAKPHANYSCKTVPER